MPDPEGRTEKMPKPLTEITQEQFKDGRNRRYGTRNPEKFEIPFWNAMVEGGHSAYTARRKFVNKEIEQDDDEDKYKDKEGDDEDEEEDEDLEAIGARLVAQLEKLNTGLSFTKLLAIPKEELTPLEFTHVEYGMDVVGEGAIYGDLKAKFWSNPIWCNNRIGDTETKLPDGTVVQIGGEHEDSYDPDFIVYNDVIVFHPPLPGTVTPTPSTFDIYGYAKPIFPPTDFHTATYIPSLTSILILGNMSACKSNEDLAARGITPVYLLNTRTWAIEKKETTGEGPGIIWKHEAAVIQDGGALRVSGTQKEDWECWQTERSVVREGKTVTEKVEYGEVWVLDLGSWVWGKEASEWVTVGKKVRKKGGGRG